MAATYIHIDGGDHPTTMSAKYDPMAHRTLHHYMTWWIVDRDEGERLLKHYWGIPCLFMLFGTDW